MLRKKVCFRWRLPVAIKYPSNTYVTHVFHLLHLSHNTQRRFKQPFLDAFRWDFRAVLALNLWHAVFLRNLELLAASPRVRTMWFIRVDTHSRNCRVVSFRPFHNVVSLVRRFFSQKRTNIHTNFNYQRWNIVCKDPIKECKIKTSKAVSSKVLSKKFWNAARVFLKRNLKKP